MKPMPQSHLAASLALSLLALNAAAQQSSLSLPNLFTVTQATNTANTNTAKATATTATTPTTAQVTSKTTALITGSGSSAASTAPIPAISTSSSGDGALTGLPTLTGGFTIVAPSVPPTANAPYMQTSKLPEGTVFIAVGAILGFLALSVILWRALVAWSLHRSVKRAAMHQNMADTKALFRTPAAPVAPFYKYSDRDSTISLSGMGLKGGRKTGRPVTSQAAASTGNLFFSPTAGVAGTGLANPGNRGSNYLPAGYYAAGASAPANGNAHVAVGGPPISLTTLGPQSQGYSRAKSIGPSPPDSPRILADGGRPNVASSSTLNLNQGYGGSERAPSAYLDDLFDGENAPPIPTHHRQHSASPRRYN